MPPYPKRHPKWRYRAIDLGSISVKDREKKMNEMGDDGWELVGIDCRRDLTYFKKPKYPLECGTSVA